MLLHAADKLLAVLLQVVARQLDVLDQQLASASGKVLPDHDAHHLHAVSVRRHCVGRNDPASCAQVVSQRELVKVVVLAAALVATREAERNKRQALATALGHDDEILLSERFGQVVGRLGQVHHDVAVAALSKAKQLVVLSDDLRRALGEVECEGRLVGAKVVDVEDEVLGKVFGCTPNDPADARVHEAVL